VDRILPSQIGKYTISEVIGHGAMGVVYKGFDPHIQRSVAIKTVHKSLLGNDQAADSIAARFRNEAKAVGRVVHPGVVAIYELGEDETTAFIAMEFVEGRSLDQILADTPLLAEAQVLSIMEQLLDALDYAHRQGVWHRDIKPANLMLATNGQLKLTDFGIARIENMGLTQVASMIGTPGHMAPEQYMGEGIDQRADVFAAGVLLYQLLAGQAPFTGNPEQVMYKILHEMPPPPSPLAHPPRSEAYDAVVAQAMAKQVEQRFASARAFHQALISAAHQNQPPQHPQHSPEQDGFTMVLPKAQWAQMLDSPGSSAASAPIPGLDGPTLSRIEHSLASYVGPMAKLMVRDAARHCTDIRSLTSAVAQHIDVEAQRQKFIHDALAGSQAQAAIHPTHSRPSSTALAFPELNPPPLTPLPTPISGTGSGMGIGSAAQPLALTEAGKAHAQHVLTLQLGPIAKILVKRAADQAKDREHFWHRLVEACPELDGDKLLRELRAGKG
jgi:serine/threonine-protein kinase